MIFTVRQAKTQLSKLIASALEGEGDHRAWRLSRLSGRRSGVGAFKGQFELTGAFLEPLPDDELSLWNGEGD